MKKSLGILMFSVPGALVATLGDWFHVHTRALSYPDPFLFGQAWWVFPGFLLVFLLMGHICLFLEGRMRRSVAMQRSVSKGSARELAETVILFALVYILSGYGNFDPVVLSVIFYAAFLARWLFTYDRSWILVLAVSMAIGGMIAEGALAELGLVAYRHADVFHVPFWLGGLYVHGAFALREGMRLFVYNSEP